jgi:hypothetical protein
MSNESLKKLYDELYISSQSPSKENNQDQKDLMGIKESEYIKIPSPEIDPITKPVPVDFPRATIPFRTSNAFQLFSEEKILYNVYFENKDDYIRIFIHERDSNPKNIYEKKFTLNELIQMNDWFKIFDNIKDLLAEFELLIKNDNLGIKLKKEGELSLYIILPNKLMHPVEIILPQNGIKEKKLFKEIYLSLLNIEQKHRQDMKRISEKLIELENALGISVNQTQHERYSIKAKENIEQMKNALKQEIQTMENEKIKFGLNTPMQ